MLPPLHILEKHVVPAGGEASVNFNTIAAQIAVWDAFIQKTSRHLCILVYAASEGAVDSRNLYVKFNGDAGNNYNDLYILGLNAAPSAAITTGATSAQVLNIPGTNYADAFGGGFILIPHAFNALNQLSYVNSPSTFAYTRLYPTGLGSTPDADPAEGITLNPQFRKA